MLGVVAGSAISNLGPNLISSFASDTISLSWSVAARLQSLSSRKGLPPELENHDLARAIRRAHLNALKFLVNGLRDAARQDSQTYDLKTIERFSKRANQWIADEMRRTARPDFLLDISLKDAVDEVHALVEGTVNSSAERMLSTLRNYAGQQAFAEFSEQLMDVEIPALVQDWFLVDESVPVGWAIAAQAFFAHTLKTDEKVRTVVFLDLMNHSIGGIRDISKSLQDALIFARAQSASLSQRFDHLETELARLGTKASGLDIEALAGAFLDALSRNDFVDVIRRVVGIEAPADAWAASRAAIDVRCRVAELSATFFGRERELLLLDEFVERNARGIAIVAAQAGAGKSALLARWLGRRRALGDVVVRHFISTRFQATTDPVDALRHLTAQLRELDGVRATEPASSIPYNQVELLDRLLARFGRSSGVSERLIVLVDGLDELSSPLRDVFVRDDIGNGVFVVVSGRATSGETPNYLRAWEDHGLGSLPTERFDIPGLSVSDVLEWLRATMDLTHTEISRLARRLRETTEGVPLFLQFVIDDLKTRLPREVTQQKRLEILEEMPTTFSKYIARELSMMREQMGAAWTDSARKLFALLTRTKGPISTEDIEAFFAFCRRADSAFPSCPVLTSIDPRIKRWLVTISEDNSIQYAFSHSRLASAFSAAVQSDADDVEESLLRWMEGAWRSVETTYGVKLGASYALDWLPAHTRDRLKARSLLLSLTFVAERLRDPRHAQVRLDRTRAELGELGRSTVIDGSDSLIRWFSLEHHKLSRAISVLSESGLGAHRVFLRWAADASVKSSDLKRPSPSALRSRSKPTGYARLIRGIVEHGGRLVSWSADGAIGFWSVKGAPLTGSVLKAHSGPITGIMSLGDRFVSWGEDGAIRFWTTKGIPQTGGAAEGHSRGVLGILKTKVGLVSWGQDNSVRFWSDEGKQLPGGGTAHSGVFLQLQEFDERVISWGNDGAIRFWSLGGELLPGGSSKAHAKGVFGVLRSDDRLVSWGGDGIIRYWTHDGTPITDGSFLAHRNGTTGALVEDGRLVTWGRDGAIRVWKGSALMGEAVGAHADAPDGVLAVNQRLVSWGADGAIRVWALDGRQLPGGATKAHKFGVGRVLKSPSQLISWGGLDDLVCFWSLEGSLVDVLVVPNGFNRVFVDGSYLFASAASLWVYPLPLR